MSAAIIQPKCIEDYLTALKLSARSIHQLSMETSLEVLAA